VLSIGWRRVGGKRWGIGLSFYFLFTYLYWKKERKDTIVFGEDSKESWMGGRSGGKRRCISYFFLYISGRYHKQTLSCRHLFCLNFHIFHLSVSPRASVFPCIVSFFSLSFLFFTLTTIARLTLHFHLVYPLSLCTSRPIHSFIHSFTHLSIHPIIHPLIQPSYTGL